MSLLEICLLGRPQVKLNGKVVEITSNRARALLYFLAASGRRHSRQHLAGLLWSDSDEEDARAKLRTELSRWLKKLFPTYIDSPRETVALKTDIGYTLDLAHFEALIKQPHATLDQLHEALNLYQGDFLEDFHIDEPLWEEWVTPERERLHQAYRRTVLRLADACGKARRFGAGIECVSQLLKREPWLEEAHAALMLLLARSGQRAAALQQYQICGNELEKEFGVPPSAETNALYDKIESGAIGPEIEATAPGLTSTPLALPIPFQAPPLVGHFVGRTQELTALAAALTASVGSRIYALSGMGGAGKSALATHLAHALRAHFPDGVLWANAANSDPLDILGTWAQAYGYNFRSLSSVENRAAALRGVLADKRTLLILDDVRSVTRTWPLLVGGTHCATLLTTRDLDIATALNAQPHSVAELTPQDGLHLLTHILGQGRVDAEPQAAKEICDLLQHLPLAVEITAQRLASRPRRRLLDMATRLRDVKERLDLAISDRAVRTSFIISWEALDLHLQRIFSLLALFEGRSFGVHALAHIAGMDGYITEDRLFALANLSLVSAVEADRYRQHPLLADFAQEQLGEANEAKAAMAVYYQAFAHRHHTNYVALRPEWENLMASMGAAYEQQLWSLVLAYADTLTQAWFVRARYTQARRAFRWAHEAALVLADQRALANHLLRWGQACMEQNDYAEAATLIAQSIAIAERLGDAAKVADAKYDLARIMLDQSNYDEAAALLAECLQLRQQLADKPGTATVIYGQATLAFHRGDYTYAEALRTHVLPLQEANNDQLGALRTVRLLADIAIDEKAYGVAEVYCQQALKLCIELEHVSELAITLYNLAVTYRGLRQLEGAQSYAQESIALLERTGDRRMQALAFYELSAILEIRQDQASALEVGLKSLHLLRELPDRFSLVYVLLHLGDLYQHFNQLDRAHALWREALTIALAQNYPMVEGLQQRLQATDG